MQKDQHLIDYLSNLKQIKGVCDKIMLKNQKLNLCNNKSNYQSRFLKINYNQGIN